MKVALLGAGRIGVMHARLLASLPDVELLVADVDPSRATAVAADVGGRAMTTVEAAIAAADALAIASSTDTHATLVRAGLARGIPMFCEKPLAKDLAGSIALAAEVEAAGGVLQLGFQRRFDPGYAEARRVVRSGELGTVYLARLAGHDPAPPAEAYIPTSGGLFRDFSVHDFDIIRWLLDAEVEEVYADGAVRGFPMFATYGDVDSAVATLRMTTGVLVAMTVSRHDPRGYDVRAELFGSRDSISVGFDARMPLRSVEPGVPAPAVAGWSGFIERFTPAYTAELVTFVDVAAGRVPSPCTTRDGVEALRIAEAATRSLAEHRPVPLAEIPLLSRRAASDPQTDPDRSPATISQVAARAGVSTATVSRVLAGVSRGRPRTRARVLEAAAALDYRPSGIARSLKLRATQMLGLVITDIGNPFFPELVRAVEDRAWELGFTLLLGNSVGDPARELAYLELLATRRVDGLIVAAADIPDRHAAWLARVALPVVLVNGQSPDGSRPAAISDNEGGGRQAADHLLSLGHRRIGLLTVAEPDQTARERLRGIVDALAAAGLDPTTMPVAVGARHVAGGETAMATLLARSPDVTGVLCHNDVMALGALRAARAAGREVPRTLSIVGFDDIDLAAYAEPALTTIAQETGVLGRWGVDRLVAILRGEDAGAAPAPALRIPTRLVVRDSTGEAPPG